MTLFGCKLYYGTLPKLAQLTSDYCMVNCDYLAILFKYVVFNVTNATFVILNRNRMQVNRI